MLACEKAGLVVVGVGPRAGLAELRHLLSVSGAIAFISQATHRGKDMREVFARLKQDGLPLIDHIIAEDDFAALPAKAMGRERALTDDSLYLLNSTSGTTGLPKCVAHNQSRWLYFHQLAVEAGALTSEDVFMSVLPAPFGFGIWTSHVTPGLLGVPTVVMPYFDATEAIQLIERHRVSVLAAVSTQFIMMLNATQSAKSVLSSLRVLFTGGEAVPYARAAAFEEKTGAAVLQFYGSNETGALSRTSLADSREKRLSTAGRLIPCMNVRLFDESGKDVTASGRGQAGCRGPLVCDGYYNDDAANRKLYTRDGWMLTGDIVEMDAEGYLSVVGRVADFIIRGGKNISGPAIEEALSKHPAIALAAAVALPDDVYGERVCVYAQLHNDATLTLADITEHLSKLDISKEWFPEHLIIVDEIPCASGGKIAKQLLRKDIRERVDRGEVNIANSSTHS